MSKLSAYGCDICGSIKEEQGIFGVSSQPDIFDHLASYPMTKTPEKASAHLCTDCYHERVSLPLDNFFSVKKVGAVEHDHKKRELSAQLRKIAIDNQHNKKFEKKFKGML